MLQSLVIASILLMATVFTMVAKAQEFRGTEAVLKADDKAKTPNAQAENKKN